MLEKDGTINVLLTEQTEMTDAERERILPLQAKSAQIMSVEETLKQAIRSLEIKLLDNPEYAKLLKFQGKLQTTRKMKREVTTILNAEYKELYKNRGIGNDELADVFADILPENKPKGKRGRPRLGA